MNNRLLLCVFLAAFVFGSGVAHAVNRIPPVTGLWCNSGGTFVVQDGLFRYYQQGKLKYSARYTVKDNILTKSGNNYEFFKSMGSTFYRRIDENGVVKNEKIRVQTRTCRYKLAGGKLVRK